MRAKQTIIYSPANKQRYYIGIFIEKLSRITVELYP